MSEAADTIVETRAKCNDLPDAEYLKECFECAPETGVLVWKRRPEWHFQSKQAMNRWNGRFPLQNAGVTRGPSGYQTVDISCTRYLSHRVVWSMFNGAIPRGMQIDHINGMRGDNRLSNLRIATNQQNSWNSKRKSGHGIFRGLPIGVSPSLSKWTSKITINGVCVCLGTFNTPEEAHEAYKKAHIEVAGEFANREVTT